MRLRHRVERLVILGILARRHLHARDQHRRTRRRYISTPSRLIRLMNASRSTRCETRRATPHIHRARVELAQLRSSDGSDILTFTRAHSLQSHSAVVSEAIAPANRSTTAADVLCKLVSFAVSTSHGARRNTKKTKTQTGDKRLEVFCYGRVRRPRRGRAR